LELLPTNFNENSIKQKTEHDRQSKRLIHEYLNRESKKISFGKYIGSIKAEARFPILIKEKIRILKTCSHKNSLDKNNSKINNNLSSNCYNQDENSEFTNDYNNFELTNNRISKKPLSGGPLNIIKNIKILNKLPPVNNNSGINCNDRNDLKPSNSLNISDSSVEGKKMIHSAKKPNKSMKSKKKRTVSYYIETDKIINLCKERQKIKELQNIFIPNCVNKTPNKLSKIIKTKILMGTPSKGTKNCLKLI
jgi:hypothetical protein